MEAVADPLLGMLGPVEGHGVAFKDGVEEVMVLECVVELGILGLGEVLDDLARLGGHPGGVLCEVTVAVVSDEGQVDLFG